MVTLHYENLHLCHRCVCVPSLVKILAKHLEVGSLCLSECTENVLLFWPFRVSSARFQGDFSYVPWKEQNRRGSQTILLSSKAHKNKQCCRAMKSNSVSQTWHTIRLFSYIKNINCTFSKQDSENFRRHPNTLKPSRSSLVSFSGQSASSPSFIRSFSSIFWPVRFLSDSPLSLLVPVFSV